MTRCWLLISLLLVTGCAHTQRLERRLDALRALAQDAREQGAYRCAPEELALSEAHLQFAAHELDAGDPARARDHLVLADLNARAALRLSTDASCAVVRAGAPEAALARPRVVPRCRELLNHTVQPAAHRWSTREHAAI